MTITRILQQVLLAALAATFTSTASAAAPDDLVGNWCFYEQEGAGQKVPEKVDIAFSADRSYVWQEGGFQQKGTWTLQDAKLDMTNVGSHKIVTMGKDAMELKRGSTMRFKKQKCSSTSFGDQDIIRLHNAASTGDMSGLQASLNTGIGINIVDSIRSDSALIKAAKFCQVPAAQLLLSKGADRSHKNDDGKTALDYARVSAFHKGCDELVKRLQ